jgi:hypothetical protein
MHKIEYNPFPSRKILKRMDFFADQAGIMNRYIQEKGHWDEHLINSKNFIIQCLKDKKPSSVAVYGSGWLLDVPMEYLLDNCNDIYLIDIKHPNQVVHKYRQEEKVHFIHADITGGAIERVYQIMKSQNEISKHLKEVNPPGIKFDFSVDFSISVNVMCQLDILILEYIRKFKFENEAAFKTLRQNIQKSHIQSLLASDSCLITDFEELVYNRTNELIETNSLIYTELPESVQSEEWTWKFDSHMTYYYNRKTYFKVKGINIFKENESMLKL